MQNFVDQLHKINRKNAYKCFRMRIFPAKNVIFVKFRGFLPVEAGCEII